MGKMVDDTGMRGKFTEMEVASAWDAVCAGLIAKHTISVRLQRSKVWVKVDSPPLRQELSYMKEGLISKLNDHLGKEVVLDMIIE